MEYQLREHQEKAVEAVLQGFRDGRQKLLVKMAVGTGPKIIPQIAVGIKTRLNFTPGNAARVKFA